MVALAIGLFAAIVLLIFADGDPTTFIAFGEEATATLKYGEEALGREVVTRPKQGHDGKFFFIQANDPWVIDPEENAAVMDRPVYRSQRIFYPVLAGGGGLFPPNVIVWALVVVNLLMLAAGSWAVAAIAKRHGAPAWVGLAFVINTGLLSELFLDGAGITAFALAALGAWALEEDRTVLAAAAFAGSALTREVMAVFVGFVGLMWLIRRRRIPWRVSVPSALAIGLWALYIRFQIDLDAGAVQVRELTLAPFSGVFEALTSGRADLADLLVIGLSLALMVVVPLRAWRSDVYLTWGAAGFAFLGPFLTVFVWQKSFDLSRALAPLATVFVLEFFLARNRRITAKTFA